MPGQVHCPASGEDASFTLLAQKSKPLLISACCEKVTQISNATENVTKTCQCMQTDGMGVGWAGGLACSEVQLSVSSMQNRMGCKDSDKCPTLAGGPAQKKVHQEVLLLQSETLNTLLFYSIILHLMNNSSRISP